MKSISKKLLIIMLILAVIFTGCSNTTNTIGDSNNNSNENEISKNINQNSQVILEKNIDKFQNYNNINNFASSTEGNKIKFYFLLEDNEGNNIIGNGKANLVIYDEYDNTLYNNTFNFFKNQFVEYQFQLTGQEIGKAYEWRISLSDIKNGYSEYGKAVLIINDKLVEENTLDIPNYSDEEIQNLMEKEYLNNSYNLNLEKINGMFRISLDKIGFFKVSKFGETQKVLRVDMIVKNEGSKSEYFNPNSLVIIDNNDNQYEKSYGGTLDKYVKIYPDVTKKGYIIFEDYPEKLEGLKLMFELGYDQNYNPRLYQYEINIE